MINKVKYFFPEVIWRIVSLALTLSLLSGTAASSQTNEVGPGFSIGPREIAPPSPPYETNRQSTQLQAVISRTSYLVEHYELSARLNENNKTINGEARLALSYLEPGISEVYLIFGSSQATVDSVKRGEDKLEYSYYQHGSAWPTPSYPYIYSKLDSLVISLGSSEPLVGQKDTISVFFATNLVNFYPADSTFQGNIAANSLFSAYGNWHPALPDIYWVSSVYDVYLDLPGDYLVAGMGDVVSQIDLEQGRRTTHLRAEGPAARGPYAFAAGKYESVNGQSGDIDIRVMLLGEYAGNGNSSKDFVAERMEWLADIFGVSYPFNSLTVVELERDYPGPSTVVPGIVFLDPSVIRDWNSDMMGWRGETLSELSKRTLLHELAHQWWGINLFTDEDYWIIEGFPVLAELLYLEDLQSENILEQALSSIRSSYLQNAGFDKEYSELSSLDHSTKEYDRYGKSAWLLWQFRNRWGDETFKAIMQLFFSENQYSEVTTKQWQEACERVTGEDLSEFFNQWYYNPGFPRFIARWDYIKSEDTGTYDTRIYLDQDDPAFNIELDFEFFLENGASHREKRIVSGQTQVEVFGLPTAPDSVIVDPDQTWLMQVDYSTIAYLLEFGDTPNNAYPYQIEFYIDSLLSLSSVELFYQVDSGPVNLISGSPGLLQNGSGMLEIPPQPTGSLIEYYLKYEDTSGMTHQYPNSFGESKNSFRVTEAPENVESLVLSVDDRPEMLLYDTKEHRVVGQINGYGGRKATWSPDGSSALVVDALQNKISFVDIYSFRILWSSPLEAKIFGNRNQPVFIPDNSYAFVPVFDTNTDGGHELLRINLLDGSFEPTSGFSLKFLIASEPLYLPGRNEIVLSGAEKNTGETFYTSYIFFVDPQSNSVISRMNIDHDYVTSIQADSLGERLFLMGSNILRTITLNPLPFSTELVYQKSCIIDSSVGPPFGGKEFPFDIIELQGAANALGVMVYQNGHTSVDCIADVVYWVTNDRLQPWRELDLTQYFPTSTPWFTISHDGKKLWFYSIWINDQLRPGFIQYDLTSHSFIEPLYITGLPENQYLGFSYTYQKQLPFGVSAVLHGDVNNDNAINIFDVISLLAALRSNSKPPDVAQGTDVNNDGTLDIFDLLHLLRLLALE